MVYYCKEFKTHYKMKIKFTKGTLKKCGEYYTIILFYNEKIIYSGIETKDTASELINKHNNIIII